MIMKLVHKVFKYWVADKIIVVLLLVLILIQFMKECVKVFQRLGSQVAIMRYGFLVRLNVFWEAKLWFIEEKWNRDVGMIWKKTKKDLLRVVNVRRRIGNVIMGFIWIRIVSVFLWNKNIKLLIRNLILAMDGIIHKQSIEKYLGIIVMGVI